MKKPSSFLVISFMLFSTCAAYSQSSINRFGDLSNVEGNTKAVAIENGEVPSREGAVFKAIPRPMVSEKPDNQKFRSLGKNRYAEGFGSMMRSTNKIVPVEENVRQRAVRNFDALVSGEAKPDRKFRGNRTVIGRDNRVNISDGSGYPFRTFGFFEITYDGWKSYGHCSATLISVSTAITAAHCVYDHDDGGWFDQGLISPGRTLGKVPYGKYSVVDAVVMSGYTENWSGKYNWDVIPTDLAVIKISGKPGRRLGVLPFGYFNPAKDFTGNIVGYPGDKPHGSMWRTSCSFNAYDVYDNTAQHYCDTASGSSGSSVYDYEKSDRSRVIIGVNVASTPEYNLSVYFNQTYFQWICNAVERFEGRSICG